GFADVGVLDDVQALGIGGHDAVLHAVVDHLDEVAGARRAAVQVAVGRRARRDLLAALDALAAGIDALDLLDLGRLDAAVARRDGLEDRAQALDGRLLAADHQAVAADQAPDAARRADVEVVDALFLVALAALDVVDVVAVAAVDQGVTLLEQSGV